MGHDAENQDRGRCMNWEGYRDENDCLATKPLYENNPGKGKHYNKCDFTYNHTYIEGGEVKSFIWDKCRLLAQEGYSYNIYICKVYLCTKYQCLDISQDSAGNNLTCANNCRGVNPNSVIIAGGAVLAEASVGGFVAPALGLGSAAVALSAAAAAGGTLAYLAALQCPRSRPCRVRQIIIKRERGIDFFSGPLSPESSAEGLL